jgi:hypothetical protein
VLSWRLLIASPSAMNRPPRFRAGIAGALLVAQLEPAAAIDRRVRIVNATSQSIVSFWGVNVDVQDWRENLLAEALPPGDALVLDFDDGSGYCRYRFRALFEDAVELVRPNVNVCEVGTYRYTD